MRTRNLPVHAWSRCAVFLMFTQIAITIIEKKKKLKKKGLPLVPVSK